jgi:hypothetical protein
MTTQNSIKLWVFLAASTRPVGEKMECSIYECGLRFRAIGVRSVEIGM